MFHHIQNLLNLKQLQFLLKKQIKVQLFFNKKNSKFVLKS